MQEDAFELGQTLGSGAFGRVFRAVHKVLYNSCFFLCDFTVVFIVYGFYCWPMFRGQNLN